MAREKPAVWWIAHAVSSRNDLIVDELEAEFSKHIGYALWWKSQEYFLDDEVRGVLSKSRIKSIERILREDSKTIHRLFSVLIDAGIVEETKESFIMIHIKEMWDKALDTRKKQSGGGKSTQEKRRKEKEELEALRADADTDALTNAEKEPAGGGKSPIKKAAPPVESSEPESEPDIDPTPEIERFRRNTQEYIRSLDCAALKQDISNRHIQLLFNNYNPVMAEAKACLFYSWKSGKLSSGEKVKNQDFYTINKKSWIDNELKTPVGKELIAEIESKHNWRHAFPRPKDWLKWTESDKRQYITEHTPKPPKPSPRDKPAPPEMLAELQAKKQALREELEGKPGGGK